MHCQNGGTENRRGDRQETLSHEPPDPEDLEFVSLMAASPPNNTSGRNTATRHSRSTATSRALASINKRSHFSSLFSGLGGTGNSYFQSEWSFAQYRIPEVRCLVAFGNDPNTVVIACGSGAYYKCRFCPRNGGEMVREEFKRFDSQGDD